MPHPRSLLLPALLLALTASVAPARDPEWGGLGAVAVSPDGKQIATGGDNRVVYILDAGKLEVTRRIWLKARVGAMAWNKDGSRLLVEDDDEVLHIFDTAAWTDTAQIAGAGDCSFAPGADLLACLAPGSKPALRILSMTDGSEKKRMELPGRAAAVALDAAGARAAVLLEAAQDPEEKKADNAAMPKDLKGLARKEWQQRNDGNMAQVVWFDAGAGKETARVKTWYSPRGRPHLFLAGETAHVVNYEDANARITPKGEVAMFEVTSGYNYGRGSSPDGRVVAGGGLRSGALVAADGAAIGKFEVDNLPGWPEYWAGFTFTADGTCYGVTSASRLVRISKEGKVEAAVPVF